MRVLMSSVTGAANFAVSRTGSLVFAPGGADNEARVRRSQVWVNRQGQEEATPRQCALMRSRGSLRMV
jgi:hypothetical protein